MPLAPMIDILFLLLIFFVTTSSFRAEEQQIDVNLAATDSGRAAEARATEIVINVKDDGAILIGNRAFEPEALRAMLRQIVRDYPDEQVTIRGDKRVAYDHIIRVLDIVRSEQVRHIFLATVKKAEEVGG